jgi:hypothetical protein
MGLLRFSEWLYPICVDFIILPQSKLDNLEVGLSRQRSNMSFGAVKVGSGFLGHRYNNEQP